MPEIVDLDGVKRRVAEGAQLLDVLSRKEYEDSRLPGAIHISLSELDEQSAAELDRDRPVIAYCYDYQ
jgi:rhodanese-related sulfurtransferase